MDSSNNVTFEIVASSVDSAQLSDELGKYFSKLDYSPEFRYIEKTRFRSIEPSVLVAIVTASATALAAFITGVLAIAKQHNAKKIVIRSDGREIDVPYDISHRDLKAVLDVLNEMERPRIIIPSDT